MIAGGKWISTRSLHAPLVPLSLSSLPPHLAYSPFLLPRRFGWGCRVISVLPCTSRWATRRPTPPLLFMPPLALPPTHDRGLRYNPASWLVPRDFCPRFFNTGAPLDTYQPRFLFSSFFLFFFFELRVYLTRSRVRSKKGFIRLHGDKFLSRLGGHVFNRVWNSSIELGQLINARRFTAVSCVRPRFSPFVRCRLKCCDEICHRDWKMLGSIEHRFFLANVHPWSDTKI